MTAASEPRLALLFPGQGVQRQGMGEPWRDTASWGLVADVSEWTGLDVEELLLAVDSETLSRTDLAQVAVFTVGLLAFREASDCHGVEPAACAGHSLGEFVALVAAGALSERDGARLVAARGRAMRRAASSSPGTMAAVLGAEHERVERIAAEARGAGEQVWVANVNAPGQVVVAGSERGVAAATSLADAGALKAIPLAVGGAFHTPLMAAAAGELRAALREAELAGPRLPVVANVDAMPHRDPAEWRELAARQLTSPVLWESSVRTLVDELGCERLLELGSGRTLTSMARRISPSAAAAAARTPAELAKLARVPELA